MEEKADTENGWHKVADDLEEAWGRARIGALEQRIIRWVVWHTYGSRAKGVDGKFAARKFCPYNTKRIADDIGASWANVRDAGYRLVQANILTKSETGEIGINTVISDWQEGVICGRDWGSKPARGVLPQVRLTPGQTLTADQTDPRSYSSMTPGQTPPLTPGHTKVSPQVRPPSYARAAEQSNNREKRGPAFPDKTKNGPRPLPPGALAWTPALRIGEPQPEALDNLGRVLPPLPPRPARPVFAEGSLEELLEFVEFPPGWLWEPLRHPAYSRLAFHDRERLDARFREVQADMNHAAELIRDGRHPPRLKADAPEPAPSPEVEPEPAASGPGRVWP